MISEAENHSSLRPYANTYVVGVSVTIDGSLTVTLPGSFTVTVP